MKKIVLLVLCLLFAGCKNLTLEDYYVHKDFYDLSKTHLSSNAELQDKYSINQNVVLNLRLIDGSNVSGKSTIKVILDAYSNSEDSVVEIKEFNFNGLSYEKDLSFQVMNFDEEKEVFTSSVLLHEFLNTEWEEVFLENSHQSLSVLVKNNDTLKKLKYYIKIRILPTIIWPT